jgi:hypothetical protein
VAIEHLVRCWYSVVQVWCDRRDRRGLEKRECHARPRTSWLPAGQMVHGSRPRHWPLEAVEERQRMLEKALEGSC